MPPESKSFLARSASSTARSRPSFAARTSATLSGSNLSPGLRPRRASCCVAFALALATRSDASAPSSSTSTSPFFTREPASTSTLSATPAAWAATSLRSSASSVPLMSSARGSRLVSTLAKRVAIGACAVPAAEACREGSGLGACSGFLHPAAARAVSPASTSAAARAPRSRRPLGSWSRRPMASEGSGMTFLFMVGSSEAMGGGEAWRATAEIGGSSGGELIAPPWAAPAGGRR